MEKTGIEQALALYDDSPTKLANAINAVTHVDGKPVLRQHVEHWLKAKKVPADRAPDEQRLTGIPCEILCPGVSWAVVRGTDDKAEGAPAIPVEGVANV